MSIESFNFLGGNYLSPDYIGDQEMVFRSRPLNLNSNIASFWISFGSLFLFNFYFISCFLSKCVQVYPNAQCITANI